VYRASWNRFLAAQNDALKAAVAEGAARYRSTRALALSLIILAALAATVLGAAVTRRITTPVRDLTRTVQRVSAERDYSLRAVRTTHDELGLLADGFNDMLSEIQKQNVALQEARDGLEEKVKVRTHDLESANAMFRVTFEQAAVGIAHVASDGRFLRVNQRFCDMVGYTREELLARTFQEITHPADLEADLENVRRMLAGEFQAYSMEKRYIRKDGTEAWIALTVSLARDAEGRPKYFISVIEDIEPRKRAEAERTHLAEIVEQASEDVIMTDVAGNITYVNPAFERISGYSRGEVLGKNPRFLKSGRRDRKFYTELWQTITSGRVWSGHFINKRKDGTLFEEEGTIFPVRDHTGKIVSFVALKRDVTREVRLAVERKAAEAATRESEERFRTIFDTAALGIAQADGEGRFVEVNPAFCRILNREKKDILGRTFIEFTHPDDLFRNVPLFEETKEGKTDRYQLTKRFVRPDGSAVTANAVVTAMRNSGSLRHFVALIEDITDKTRMEEELRQAQKMEAVGRLAGGVAHDFNNLLTVIQGYAELLGASLANDPERRESMGEIVRAAERAAALTRQLLAFSRRQVLETRILDLGEVVADTEKMLRRLIGEDLEVVVVKPATLGHVKADPGQIEQVLLNLAVNSRDAMPGGGRLTLELADVNLDAPFTTSHDSIPSGRYVVVSVRDTGNGMDAETLSHLFEPFFTTKEKGKGTGLGLATVFGIVKQSGGYVDVASAPGAGTTFRVYLPRSDARTTSGVRPRVSSRSGSETVLVVEDEAAVRNLVRAVLERKGYVVLVAQDGAAALELVDKHTGVIHVLLTDVVMPGMNGRELATLVTARRPKVKVIFMSGYAAGVPAEFGAEGGPAFLSKPFNERTLTAKLREVLDIL
jgi:two-component system cell cycle sensor histidine kinase/response regulator CckA